MQLNTDLTDKDLEQYRAFGSVIAQGKFDLQGSAIVKVASLVQWYGSLGVKLQDAVKRQALEKSKAAAKKSIKQLETK